MLDLVIPRSAMDTVSHLGPPGAAGLSDALYSFVVRLNGPPAWHWVYAFTQITGSFKDL